jgi:fused signal recognition particle receptor
MGFFNKLKEGLKKTKNVITERIDQVLVSFGKIDEELFEDIGCGGRGKCKNY